MRPFHLEIATPDGTVFDGEAESILLRTDDGDVEIMCGHADFLATVGVGRTRILAGGEERFASSAGGFISVRDGVVKMMAITFEFADQIDIERAKMAKERAEDALHESTDERSQRIAKAKLARALNRINISSMK